MNPLLDKASEILGEKISVGIVLHRKPDRDRGFEGGGTGTVFDIVLLLIALAWIPLQRMWDPASAVLLAFTERQLYFFKVNEGAFQSSLGGITNQRGLKELDSIGFHGDDRREVRFRFTDSSETKLYFQGETSELDSFVVRTSQYQKRT